MTFTNKRSNIKLLLLFVSLPMTYYEIVIYIYNNINFEANTYFYLCILCCHCTIVAYFISLCYRFIFINITIGQVN